MRRALALLALVLACTAVRGAPSTSGQVPTIVRASPGILETVLAGKEYIPSSTNGRQYTSSPSGGVTITDPAKGTLPTGKTVDFAVKRQVAAQAARSAMKAVAKNLVPGVGIAVALWEALEDQGIERADDGTPRIDPGAPQVVGGTGKLADFRTGQPITPAALASREAGYYCAGTNWTANPDNMMQCTVTYAEGYCAGGTCYYRWENRVLSMSGSVLWSVGSQGWTSGQEIVGAHCPESNSTLRVRGGNPCPTNDRVPAPPDIVDDAADDVPPDLLPDILKGMDAADYPGVVTSEQPGEAPSVQGPGSVEDGVETTTRPDGSIERRRREWEFDYPPGPVPTIEYEPKIIEGEPGDETTTEGEIPEIPPEAQTDCDKYPDSIGCAEFGDPDDSELERRTVDIDLQSDSLGDGSCPESPSFQALGRTYTIDLAALCSAGSTYVKPLVVLIAGLVAGLIFVGGLKS